uniref:Uncharacterized protein n=1 Tax=Macaca mulatta TaxID=9544 RepID=A0A5F7ZVF6_MACMU
MCHLDVRIVMKILSRADEDRPSTIHIQWNYFLVGLSQSISTKHPETSPKDSRIRENDVTADGRTTEDHITADPGTTEDSVTADPGTTEDSVTADPGTTEHSVTAGSWTTEDEITKLGDIHLLRTTSVTAVKPTRLLTPIGIILISLTATTVTVALCWTGLHCGEYLFWEYSGHHRNKAI